MLRRCLRRCDVVANSFDDQYRSTGSGMKGGPGHSKTSLLVSIVNRSGSMVELLTPFRDVGINIHHVGNREVSYESATRHQTIFLDVDAHVDDVNMKIALESIKSTSKAVQVVGSWKIPWYPTAIQELDLLDQKTLAAGAELQDDPANPHPGFHDEEYRSRRRIITDLAMAYRQGQKIQCVDYTRKETDTWTAVWDKLTALYPTHACRQYNYSFPLLVENGGFRRESIPQLQIVSDYLNSVTGFTIRPVAGLLSARDFFSALAFRVFFSTQYLRHHSQPFYTPEPDLVHELMGHAPLFADPDFASFSQTLGMASLGASDDVIQGLARCYWYTVEFGLCRQAGSVRAFGAGLLSSFGELEYCLTSKPQLKPWDPYEASRVEFPITKYQPLYFVAEDFVSAQEKLCKWIDNLDHPFRLRYNPHSKTIETFPKTTHSMLVYK